MATFTVLGTNHTSFTVSSLDRSLGFFRDAMGFEVTAKAPRSRRLIETVTGVAGADVLIAYVKGPGHVLELIEYVGPDGRASVRPRPCDVGFAHVAYDVDDLDAAIAAAAGHGFAPLGPTAVVDQGPNRSLRVVYVRDADGLTVELLEKRR